MKKQTEAVYNFIKNSDHPVTQREIYEHMLNSGYPLRWNDSQNMHNDHIRKLHSIVEEINRSTDVDELIFQHAYKYSIATREQVEIMVEFYHAKGVAAFNLRNYILKKKRWEGQFDLTTGKFHSTYGE